MSWRGWFLRLLTIAVVASDCPQAQADPAPDPAALLRTGMEAAAAKKWPACIDALSAAAAIEDAPKTWGELGLCEEQAGRFVAAHDHLFRAMEAAPTQGRKEPWTRYQAALARVKERVAVMIVTAFPPNAKVVLDGRPLGPADGRAFAVEPGAHTVGARLAGYEDQVETRTVRARDVPTFHFQLVAKRAVPLQLDDAGRSSSDSGTPKQPFSGHPSLASLFVPAWSFRGVVLGLTYAGLATVAVAGGTSIGLEIDRASMRSHVESTSCNLSVSSRPAICAPLAERRAQRDTAVDLTIGAGIATGVLGALSAVAITREWKASSLTVAPAVTGQGGGVVLGGVW